MLNRIYIFIGSLAIVLLAGAFIAPLLIDWNSYRERMQYIAQKAFGKEVRIKGDMSLFLLPQPKISFENVVIGKDDAIVAKIASVSAKFSLLDFLRDRYNVTGLTLNSARFFLIIDESGKLVAPFNLPETIENSNISIANAIIDNGSIEISDARVGEVFVADNFMGQLSLAGLRGPFSLQGVGQYKGKNYSLRVNSSSVNLNGEMSLGSFLQPVSGDFSLKIDGILKVNNFPEFRGKVDLRHFALAKEQDKGSNELGIKGDFTFNSEIEASLNEVLFKDYIIVPDENLPATRLSGAASIDLRNKRNFNAVISGGIVSLGFHSEFNKDKTKEFALLRFLRELPFPIIPPIAGQVNVDLLELDLGAFSLKEVRLDAKTNGKNWYIEEFSSQLASKAHLKLSGELSKANERAIFDGNISLTGEQFELLAKNWRRPKEDSGLFNIPFSLSSQVQFSEEALLLNKAKFMLDNVENELSLNIGLGKKSDLAIFATLGEWSKKQSKKLFNLLPKTGDGTNFDASFSSLIFDLQAKSFSLFDLPLRDIVAIGSFANDKINLSKFISSDIAGARVEMSGTYDIASNNSTNERALWGQGRFSQADLTKQGILFSVLENLAIFDNNQEIIKKLLPLDLEFSLSKPKESVAQQLKLIGKFGNADIDFILETNNGIFELTKAPIKSEIVTKFANPLGFSELFRLSNMELFSSEEPVVLSAKFDGTIMNSLGANISLANKAESVIFDGNIIVSDLSNLRGNGQLKIITKDISPFMEVAGISDFAYVPFTGTGAVRFISNEEIKLSEIEGAIGKNPLEGELKRKETGGNINISGSLNTNELELSSLAILLGGSSSIIEGDIWPIGPFSLPLIDNNMRLAINVGAGSILHNGQELASDASFEYILDKNNISIRDLKAKIAGQEIILDLEVCCAGSLAQSSLNGRVSFENLDIDRIYLDRIAKTIQGQITGLMQFSGTGNSYSEIIASLAGEGSVMIEDFEVNKLNENIFTDILTDVNVAQMQESELEATILGALNDGELKAARISSVISIAGGNLRASNVSVQADEAQLFGSIRLNLLDLSLAGKWALTPLKIVNSSAVLDQTNALISILVKGSLFAPNIEFDLADLIDGVVVRALEREVDRLEKLRLEAEERSRQAASARAKLMEQQAKARAEAEKLAEIEAKKQKDLEAQQQNNTPLVIAPPTNDSPINLLPDSLNVPDPIFNNIYEWGYPR